MYIIVTPSLSQSEPEVDQSGSNNEDEDMKPSGLHLELTYERQAADTFTTRLQQALDQPLTAPSPTKRVKSEPIEDEEEQVCDLAMSAARERDRAFRFEQKLRLVLRTKLDVWLCG